MVEQEVEEFLEHHGVKGMRWGVRNNRVGSNKRQNKAKQYQRYAELSPTRANIRRAKSVQKKADRSNLRRVGRAAVIGVGAGVAVATAVGAGTLFASKWLLTKGNIRLSDMDDFKF